MLLPEAAMLSLPNPWAGWLAVGLLPGSVRLPPPLGSCPNSPSWHSVTNAVLAVTTCAPVCLSNWHLSAMKSGMVPVPGK